MADRSRYVDLRINGRLFPSWVLANFPEYKLPEIDISGKEDPCKKKEKTPGKRTPHPYQAFIAAFLDYTGPYRNMLLYHGVGSGKTVAAINVINMLHRYTPAWNVYIILRATLKDQPWLKDLRNWLSNDADLDGINFISYDAPNADKAFMDAVRKSDTTRSSIYIVEECHNFINNVYTNINSRQGSRAQTIYEHIISDVKDNPQTRVLALSATPAVNNPYELAILFNMLRPNTFPRSEVEFRDIYISSRDIDVLDPVHKNNFQRRIIGLVSYYLGATPDKFASSSTHYVDIKMSKYQEGIYNHFQELENKIEQKIHSQGGSTTYKSYTRQACNFVFPLLKQGISGETRPRPRDYSISENEASRISQGLINQILEDKNNKYINALKDFITEFDKYLKERQQKDVTQKYTITDDIKKIWEHYDGDINMYAKSSENKSTLFEGMYTCSAKMLAIVINILKSKGPVLVYSNYVLMEGLEIFKIYLKYFGFTKFEDPKKGVDGFRYMEYHGKVEKATRSVNLGIFNNPKNIHGNLCKIIMISAAGAEGISLLNTRQVHIMEPYWQEVRITQIIGRAIRQCSHADLPIDERHVDVYRYKSVHREDKRPTTDQYLENVAREKATLIKSFLDAVKEVAVDCELNKNHNKLLENYKCFKFEEPSLFEKPVGPAFRMDIRDDLKYDNGSNSISAKTIKLKVININAVKQLDKDGKKYSKPDNYLYNPNSGVVYEPELHYQIGKVGLDENGIPKMLNQKTYIIDKLVPIPLVK